MQRLMIHMAIALIASLGWSLAKADLVVESWLLGTGVSDSDSPDNPSESDASETVENPYTESLMAELNGSTSTAVHNFTWNGSNGSFDINVTHFLQELRGSTGTEGRITVRPSVDSIIDFDAFFDFSWPSEAIGGSALGFGVIDLATQKGVITDTDSGGNVGLGPPFGTLNVSGSALLLADGQYEILYNAFIDHFTPTPPGTHGDGSGNILFTITPVPEPATASLLLAGLLIHRQHTRRWQRSCYW